ncbi:nucleotidyltransferase domain-containing protein [Shewanella algae]|uniref:nucleotidyltransferase domain-containing protein n=1 Tax=Shewanella algae TaxID=38313 RepID=UPI001AADBA81|nr:nucleotidyltransferase [Shewanella algae]MBO2683072.1 nucleotidyltransferase [Shewanella algae]
MAELQQQMLAYHDQIKLGTYEENKDLREKRDLLLDELKESLAEEKVPNTDRKLTFSKLDQGSYAMHTGVKPLDGDYDIDVGVIFDITTDEYDSRALKKLVRDKLNDNNITVFNRPCITVKYQAGYHVDLPIYARKDGDIHIAWGKEFSAEYRWYEADPDGLKTWVNAVSTDSDARAQFRRCVRYLKRWKDKHFSNNGNVAPPSIGLTIQARNAFTYKAGSDLDCLITIVNSIKSSFSNTVDLETMAIKKTVAVNLPVKPYKNVYYKMTLAQLDNYYYKVDALLEALECARDNDSAYEASKLLRKIFGDFPLIEDSRAITQPPYVMTGHNA